MNIKGTIPFEMTFDSEKGHEFKYTSTVENDIAAMAATLRIMETNLADQKGMKKEYTGRIKKQLSHNIHDISKATHQIRVLLENLCDGYVEYKKRHPAAEKVETAESNSITEL